VSRSRDDEFLLLASDGLWDVFSNADAADLAARCIGRAGERGAGRRAALRIAASVLTKAAVDRGSKDNVTVVVVDLRTGDSSSGDLSKASAPSSGALSD
jgi:protein phosphatase 2C